MIKTQRLAQWILLAVGLFVLAVASALVTRVRSVPPEVRGPRPRLAELSIKEVRVQEQTARGQRWRLWADQAAVFGAEGRTALQRVRVRVEDRDRAWTIVGDEGDYFEKAKRLEIRRNVVVTSDDGLRLETSLLRWHGAEQRLETDRPVRISEDGAVIDGTALEVRLDEEVATVRGRVHAVFSRGPRS